MALAVPLAGPLALLVLLRGFERLDISYQNVSFHLVFVSAIAGCALVIALVAGRAATQAAHCGPVWLAVGCLSIGFVMLGHGLTTPGVGDRPMNLWVARTPYLAIWLFAVSMALASRPRNTATSRLATLHPMTVIVAAGVILAAFMGWVVTDPTRLSGTQPIAHEDQIKTCVALVAAVLLLIVAAIHWRRWRLGKDPVQYALMLAATMSTAALMSLRVGELWRLSWWDYHGFLLAGFAGAVYAVLIRYRRTKAVDQVLAATFESDPMTHIVEGYPDALKALVHAVEVKDRYTHGHSERTAKIAVQLGERLRLDEDTLRALARGAYLHDVGKIAIQDDILNKPAALTDAERSIIETHPNVGYELVVPADALREALPVVLHHHERWDGTGYPHGLSGTNIPLIARVAAMADVWDALTSDRSYRLGLEPHLALAHIEAGSGTHFDPVVVDAMRSLAADWGYRAVGDGDAAQGWRATERCHESASSRA